IDELLQTSLSQQAWSIDKQVCNHCSFNKQAIWRCVNCLLGRTPCRICMWVTHRQNPFHRIESWTGTHFHRAELWEVGTYLLVQHQTDQPICNALQFQMEYLETFEDMKDKAEQEPSTANALNNSYICVMHTNGIHPLAMVTCQCQGEHRIPLDLVSSNLLPTSFNKIHTLFTMYVLDHFQLCNLELKASAYQFYQLIQHVTLPMRPGEVVNLYHELRCMSHLWRWMKRLKWAGYGHNQKDPLKPEPGSLANFCPPCPQVGINIPENWKDDENRFVFKHVFVADGNFKADHVRQKNSDTDIWLWDGAGMAPNQAEYKQFLQDAIEQLTKAPCENKFLAIVNAFLASKACDRTGVAAIACAQHGCYTPNALVDLFWGEQQKNVAFAFLQALKTTRVDPQLGVMLIYDIVCQYIIYLLERIGPHLSADLTIDQAIGLMHVHGHKDKCFFRYAPSFIPGSGIVAGEILESLWSSLNSIFPTVRTVTLPHRAEMLDNHAMDSNHKKMLGMTAMLCAKSQESLEISMQLSKHHADLTAAFGQQAVQRWEDEVTAAESLRLTDVKALDIYATQGSGVGVGMSLALEMGAALAPVQSVVEEWIDFTIIIQQMQIELRDKVHRLGTSPNVSDMQSVEREREALTSHMETLTDLQNAANVANHDIAPSQISHYNVDNSDDFICIALNFLDSQVSTLASLTGSET
ncbi:hypothetical protein L208DRAFT_1325044, partial [Tricholoma matsutake]